MGEWPGGAVHEGVAVEDVGPHRFAVLVADAEPIGGPQGHVVVDDVGAGHELEGDAQTLGLLEVEGDVPFAPLAAHERPDDVTAHAVAAGRLHLDHVGPQIGQQHGAEGAGQVLPEIDDPQTFEWTGHQTTPLARR